MSPPVIAHWVRLSLLQNLVTEVQDFFAAALPFGRPGEGLTVHLRR